MLTIGVASSMLVWALLSTCTPSTSPFSGPSAHERAPVTAPPWLRFEYDGCVHVFGRPGEEVECIYEPKTQLTLWVAHNLDAEPTISVLGPHGEAQKATWERVDEFVRNDELGRGYHIRLNGTELDALVVSRGGLEQRLRLRSTAMLTEEERGVRERTMARRAMLETWLAKDDAVAAIDGVEWLVREAAEQGLVSEAVELGAVGSYHMGRLGQPERGQALLEGLRYIADRYPRGRAVINIYLGDILHAQGLGTDAARHYRDGGRFAVRMDDVRLQLDSLPRYAMALAELGYFEAAAHWAKEAHEVISRADRAVDRAMAQDLVARVGLHLLRARRIHDDPRPWFEGVLTKYAPGGPLDALREPEGTRLDLAEVELLEGNFAEARRWLDTVDEAKLRSERRARFQELHLRTLLDEPTPSESALRAQLQTELHRLDTLTARVPSVQSQWRAQVVRGMVHERFDERAEAIAAYEKSEELLDTLLSTMALGVPGDAAVAYGGDAVQRLVSLLVTEGELDEAVCVARQSRARAASLARAHHGAELGGHGSRQDLVEYRSLREKYEALLRKNETLSSLGRARAMVDTEKLRQEIDAFEQELLSASGRRVRRPRCDELLPRATGELMLVLLPHEDALRVFMVDDEGSTHTVIEGYGDAAETIDPRWLSDLLLAPARERIEAASGIRVLASGRASAIAVHALPWPVTSSAKSTLLGLEVPVVYGLDLPVDEPSPPRQSHRAVLVADGWSDGASEEVETIHQGLADRAYSVFEWAADALSSSNLLRELRTADIFHYAGHAYYADVATEGIRRVDDDDRLRLWPPYSGGAAAVPSFIPMADQDRLTVPQILIESQMPPIVVLMGCATGVIDERRAHGGFSLATAFLASGSRVVVASTGKIDGREASILGRALHSVIGSDSAADPLTEPGRWMSEALRAALAKGLPERAVADYRIYVP